MAWIRAIFDCSARRSGFALKDYFADLFNWVQRTNSTGLVNEVLSDGTSTVVTRMVCGSLCFRPHPLLAEPETYSLVDLVTNFPEFAQLVLIRALIL